MADWTTVASTEEVFAGQMASGTVDGVEVVVAKVGDRYRAFGAECTHASCDLVDGELDEEEGTVTCACHGSVFEVETGKPVEPPAEDPVPVFEVRVEGDEIQVAAPGA